jgi:hypothetical protein
MADINQLRGLIKWLPEKDHSFARDLVKAGEKYGVLSPNRQKWVDILVNKAEAASNGVKSPEVVQVGDLKKVIELFDKARAHLKHPKIVLQTKDNRHQVIRLTVAGERAKVPGSINVTDLGAYETRTWFGRITRDGEFQPSAAANEIQGLTEALKAFAADPVKVAAEYGHLSGNCCFCSRQLDDTRSTEVGYGPVCADHYGLPWGAKRKEVSTPNHDQACERHGD